MSTREKQVATALTSIGKTIAVALVDAVTTCVNCDHFDEPSEQCRLANARPPARVIAFGCSSYISAKDIPF
jgi:hypothetical protein